MQCQLRIYTIKPGEMAAWIQEWSSLVRPLRIARGFVVLGSWTIEGENKFVWILAHGGTEQWETMESAYYSSPERAALKPDPARHVLESEQWMLTTV